MVHLSAAKSGKIQDAAGDTNQPVGEESWNWPDKTPLTVCCYTNCQEVTLTLNDRPLGTKRLSDAVDGILSWEIPYAPGVLKAVGRTNRQALCEFALKTAGPASRIELRPDIAQLPADGKAICQLEFDVVDAQGVRVPNAGQELTFALSGPAQILGLGNGDVTNSEPVKGPVHRVYQGRGLAIVQSSTSAGAITLKASAPGLESANVTLSSR